jgi:hypothetical protein
MGPRVGDMAAIVWLLKAQQASKIQLISVLKHNLCDEARNVPLGAGFWQSLDIPA